MSFYKRSIHSFLGQTNPKTMPFENEIIGSVETRDLRGIRIAEEANGLTLCTEYLGFESYDMKMSENEVKICHAEEETERVERKRRKTAEENVVAPAREGKREYPPPLSSLNGRGQRSFYLRPVRKDGRLELTQVMIDRPEVFHASRENGRLRLHLVTGTTRKEDRCEGNLRARKCIGNPIKAYCDSEEVVDLKDEPKDNTDTSDQLVDLSRTKDDSGTGSSRYQSNEELSSDENGARKWRYKNCYQGRNNDEYEHHHHHHHHHHQHHIHPYHHCNSNNNVHLWSQSYVKTR